jgi:16S rRNA (guanine527-N7)-methyltransferase
MFRELLSQGFTLTGTQLDQLEEHFKLLNLWNKRLNLTRIVDLKQAVELHYHESLFLASLIPLGHQRIVDVGSGAGFPGIPVAVFRPECSVDLVESHKRKSVFLREASRNLPNVKVLPDRAESLSQSYDWMIARAVRPEDVLSLRLAANVAILMSVDDLNQTRPFKAEKSPWGAKRVVGLFHVKQ